MYNYYLGMARQVPTDWIGAQAELTFSFASDCGRLEEFSHPEEVCSYSWLEQHSLTEVVELLSIVSELRKELAERQQERVGGSSDRVAVKHTSVLWFRVAAHN